MSEQNIELYALRGQKVRPATPAEIETTKAFFSVGKGEKSEIGFFFIHGFTVTPANFFHYAKKIADQGYAVALPQLPGHATNPADSLKITWHDWLSAIESEYAKFATGKKKIFVVGISLGGSLALHLAKKFNNITRLFLLAPAVYPVPLLQIAMFTVVPIMTLFNMPYWMHVAGDVKRPDGFEIGYKKTPVFGLRQLFDCMMATQKILPEVKTASTIIQGKVDHEVPAKRAAEILAKLGSKDKELIWLENSYHEILRDFDADFVFNKIMEISGK